MFRALQTLAVALPLLIFPMASFSPAGAQIADETCGLLLSEGLCGTVNGLAGITPGRIAPADGTPGGWFGHAIDVDGDTVIAGAPHYGNGPYSTEGVYVFRGVPELGIMFQEARLQNDDFVGGGFGHSVAINGDVAIVGEPWGGASGEGRAHVFERDAAKGLWSQTAILLPDLAACGGAWGFGYDVEIDDDTIVVLQQGCGVWFFARDPSSSAWVREGFIYDPYGYGESMAFDDGTVLVGEPWGCWNLCSGYVRIYAKDGGEFQVPVVLEPESAAGWGDEFGVSVAIEGDVALVGASGQGIGGAAYAFVRDAETGEWQKDGELTSPLIVGPEALYGWSIDLEGKHAVVGAPGGAGDWRAGKAHVFERDAGTGAWNEIATQQVDGERYPYDGFGTSVAIGSGVVVVGFPGDDDVADDAGSAYLYPLL